MAPFSSLNKNRKDAPELTPQSPYSHLDANFPHRSLTFKHQMLFSNNPPANAKVKQKPEGRQGGGTPQEGRLRSHTQLIRLPLPIYTSHFLLIP